MPPRERLGRIGALISKLSLQHIAPGDCLREIGRPVPELEAAKLLQVRPTRA